MPDAFAFRLLSSILITALILSSCDIFTGANDELADQISQRVQDRRQQWQDQNIEDYQLIYSQQVGEVLVDSVEVFVRSGMVDSIVTSRDISEEEVLVGTVDSFFDLIEARIGEDESQFTADFNPNRGFPTRYTADFQDDRRSQTVLTNALIDSVKCVE